MAVIVWIVEGTWPACVDAARIHAPESADFVLQAARRATGRPCTRVERVGREVVAAADGAELLILPATATAPTSGRKPSAPPAASAAPPLVQNHPGPVQITVFAVRLAPKG